MDAFGKSSGPASLQGDVRPRFGNPPTSPSPPPVESAGGGWSPQPQVVSPQPWQQPRSRFITQSGVQFPNGGSETSRRMRSPFLIVDSRSVDDLYSPNEEVERSDVSSHLVSHPEFPPNNSIQKFTSGVFHAFANDGETSFQTMSTKVQVPKRIRSPPEPSASVPVTVSHFAEADAEREMQAKAKRLARFHAELSQPVESPSDFSRKTLGIKNSQIQPNKVKFPVGDSTEKSGDAFDGGFSSDYEGLESFPEICGLCPDMCPESEREERERKGDLDKYERLDGERNQTSASLAVKKYNRTAERDADLIRPLPVLQRTVDYLLDLLNQPYDGQFLGLYNFLWDRMRAIRMDLRMQHIFNHDAIHMLEQMIRLHIIVMHELSENKKGEGFSEGFDAHLNIEQMNKTSVELFQMYDDHRKKGSIISTEKEFRGYYALLKLDKHPGYRVEPAELSLDLAKMTPEVRCSPEILFARNVARACRTGNFIAFFRLARKATYLQACLMHAHFAKLRTQALASLYSGLQSNQGIPVSLVVKWLAMEGEDIESLLEYHGFSTKRFEELYMVKEGPFVNGEADYPTKCSQLVKLKRSNRVVDDVCCDHLRLSVDEGRKPLLDVTNTIIQRNVENYATEAFVDTADDIMLGYEFDYSPPTDMQSDRIIEEPSSSCLEGDVQDNMGDVPTSVGLGVAVAEPLYVNSLISTDYLLSEPVRVGLFNGIVASSVDERLLQVEAPGSSKAVQIMEHSLDEQAFPAYTDGGQLIQKLHEKDEAARARLKLILRIWKQRSSKKREMRERRQSLRDAALSSLSLGPPVCQNEIPSHTGGDLDIDSVVRARYARHERSWSRLNVSEVVAPILSTRNPLAECLFWKLALCLQKNDSGSKSNHLVLPWLLWKLMGTGRESDDKHVIYSSNLSVWKKPLNGQDEVGFPKSCYSVVRELVVDRNMPAAQDGTMAGISAVIFLVSESIPWAIQKFRLDSILISIPSGSIIPLLILCSDSCRSFPDPQSVIVSGLGLQYLDKTVISDYTIVFLDGDHSPENTNVLFFSDDCLKDGLQWLAENSPRQPCLRLVKTRELILNLLNSSLAALENVKPSSEVGPDHCIALFNEALDRSAEEICFAADINKNCWPGPEIDLLRDLPYDSHIVDTLPSRDWSSAVRIEPLIKAIGSCKLPSFSNDLSWLNRGYGGRDITGPKLALEQCLFNYLNDTVGLVGGNLAAKEVSVMVQKGTGLQLRGNQYYIIPRWLMIFRRIYHWRLTSLSSGKFASAYVLDRGIPVHAEPWASFDVRRHSMAHVELNELEDNLVPEGLPQVHSALTQLSLDELIEVSCSIPATWQPKSVNNKNQAPDISNILLGAVPDTDADPHEGDGLLIRGGTSESRDFLPVKLNKETKEGDEGRKVDKLDALLERCNRLQDSIDEKLAVYF